MQANSNVNLDSSAAAAAVLAHWVTFAPEVNKPGVQHAIAFARGAPREDRTWPELCSLWLVALRYRSQTWCVRACLQPQRQLDGPGIAAAIGHPLDCRKLLAIVESELARCSAGASSGLRARAQNGEANGRPTARRPRRPANGPPQWLREVPGQPDCCVPCVVCCGRVRPGSA
jgi:hypothetical protein